MKTVYFFPNGQFCNNLFQYFAAEIVKKLYGYDEVKPTIVINLEFNTVISDEAFKKICEFDERGELYPIDTSKNILMNGYFQRSEIFKKYREYLKPLFNINNPNYISNRTCISNILKYQTKHTISPTENDLVMHIRLSDFYDKVHNTSQLYDPDQLKDIIKTITYDKLYIVSTSPNQSWEKEYLSYFDNLNPIYINGNAGDDFDFLLKSNKILTSASTYSWMGAYLGNASEVYIPYNTFHGGYESINQSLADFSDNCKVFYNMDYWFSKIN